MNNNFEGFLPDSSFVNMNKYLFDDNESKHPFCDKAIEIITKRLFDYETRDAIKYAMTECFDIEKHFSDFELNSMASMIQEEVVCQIRRGEKHAHLKSWGKFQNKKLYEEVCSE